MNFRVTDIIKRRENQYFCLKLLIILTSFCLTYTTALAAPDDWASKIEQAKRENRLMIYSSLNFADMEQMTKSFQKKYPFVKTEYTRTGGQQLLNKILNEAKAKRHVPDLIIQGTFEMYLIRKAGLLAKYLSPERKILSEQFRDSEGYITAFFNTTKPIVYNTKLVPPDMAPKSFADLLEPKWARRMSFVREGGGSGIRWFISLMKYMGEKKGEEFARKLNSQKLAFVSGTPLANQLVAAGEHALTIVSSGFLVEALKDQGAKVEWVRTDPMFTTHTGISLSANATHPGSAQLFIDYILSKEGQELLRGMHRMPVRLDVEPDPPSLIRGINLFPYDPDWVEDYNRFSKIYYEIFR